MANIMVIDDDTEVSDAISAELLKAGHTISSLDTTEGAIARLKESAPNLLILDVMFPGNPSAGMELAIEIRKHDQLKKLPIIMLTGVNQNVPMKFSERDIDPKWMPVQHFIEKPVQPAKLLSLVERCLRG